MRHMKMKSALAGVMLLAATNLCQAAEDYLDTIAKGVCECAAQIPEDTPPNQMNANAGVCIIKQLPPYREKLKADYGIDLDHIDADGERMGQIVGMRLAMACPATLMKVSNKSQAGKPVVVENTIQGEVTRVENDSFVVFSVKDGTGRTLKLYWMTQVTSSVDLVNGYQSLLGKTIKVTYQPKDFFDPKVSDYRQFNVITKIW